MFQPILDPQWPESWKKIYSVDQAEVWGKSPPSATSSSWYARTRPVFQSVQRCLPSGARLIDVASSQGNLGITLADLGYRITWNDRRVELVDYVKLKDPEGRLEYLPGNIFDVAMSHAEGWDGVVATEVIEHVAHPDELLIALATLVKPGGFLFMSTPNGQYFRDRHPRFSDCEDASVFEAEQFKPDADGHIFFLHRDEIESLAAKARLNLVDYQVVGNPLTSGHIKLGHLLPYLPPRAVTGIERMTQRLPEKKRSVVHRHSIFTLQRVRA